jgi:hypothetical protein
MVHGTAEGEILPEQLETAFIVPARLIIIGRVAAIGERIRPAGAT